MNDQEIQGGGMTEKALPKEVQEMMRRVESFALLARVPNVEGTVCGDGGIPFELKTTRGRKVEVAGRAGDLGQDPATIFAIMAYYRKHGIAYDPVALAMKVVDAYKEEFGVFQFHTSNHVHPPVKITDCGDNHAKMVEENSEAYGLDAGEVRVVIETTQEMASNDTTGEIEEVTLADRNHEEFVLGVIEGDTHTIVHWLMEGDKHVADGISEEVFGMMFVIDPKRAETRRARVLQRLEFDDAALGEIQAIKRSHDGVTSGLLAEGKMGFGINVDAEKPKVSYLGRVQKDGSLA